MSNAKPTNETRRPQSFVFVANPEPVREEPTWLPPELRGICCDCNIHGSEAVGKYGAHKLRMIKKRYVSGQIVEEGDEVTVPGNVAAEMITRRWAVSLDPRREREESIIAEAARMRIKLQDSENPAFTGENLIPRKRVYDVREVRLP